MIRRNFTLLLQFIVGCGIVIGFMCPLWGRDSVVIYIGDVVLLLLALAVLVVLIMTNKDMKRIKRYRNKQF